MIFEVLSFDLCNATSLSCFQVGFEMINVLARKEGVLMNTIQSKALIGIGCYFSCFRFFCLNHIKADDFLLLCMISTGAIEEVPILLAKPQTYMNFSGESVCIF